MQLERYRLFSDKSFTTGTAAGTTWVTPGIPINHAAIGLYGRIRQRTGGTLSATGTLGTFWAVIQFEETWGTLVLTPGVSHQMSFTTSEVVGTVLGNGALFSLLPATDAYGIFAEEASLPIKSVKFLVSKPSGVAETISLDIDVYQWVRGWSGDQVGTVEQLLGGPTTS